MLGKIFKNNFRGQNFGIAEALVRQFGKNWVVNNAKFIWYRSGLQAYRQSLAVTGQNIANINTDGYKKEASLEEVTGAGGGVTEISDQTGLGVRVENIKRAFDQFLIDKVRQTSSLYQKSDSYLQEVKDLENLLLPSDANLSNSIGEYFGSLQQIAAAPDDQAPRVIALEKGKDLTGQFNLYADRIERLKTKIYDKAKMDYLS